MTNGMVQGELHGGEGFSSTGGNGQREDTGSAFRARNAGITNVTTGGIHHARRRVCGQLIHIRRDTRRQFLDGEPSTALLGSGRIEKSFRVEKVRIAKGGEQHAGEEFQLPVRVGISGIFGTNPGWERRDIAGKD